MSDQRFNTGNPIGSDSPLDRSDNTRDFDERMNSEEPVGKGRFGQPVLNWAGIQAAGTGDTSIAVDAAARAVGAAGRAEAAEAMVDRANIKDLVQEAEAARDAAFVNADVYPDVATGRAAVADGEQFQVVAGDEIVRYRRDSASVSPEVARWMNSRGVKSADNGIDTARFAESVGVANRFTMDYYDLSKKPPVAAVSGTTFEVVDGGGIPAIKMTARASDGGGAAQWSFAGDAINAPVVSFGFEVISSQASTGTTRLSVQWRDSAGGTIRTDSFDKVFPVSGDPVWFIERITPPAGAALVRMGIYAYGDAGNRERETVITKLMCCKGEFSRYIPSPPGDVAPGPEPEGKKPRIVFISPTGLDSNDGSRDAPLKSLRVAVDAIQGHGTVMVLSGDYGVVDFDWANGQNAWEPKDMHHVTIIGEVDGISKKRPVIRFGDPLTGITLVSGKVYKAVANRPVTAVNLNWIWQDGVADATTLVPADEWHSLLRGRAHRLPCTRIIKTTATDLADAIAEIESSPTPKCFYDGSTNEIYFSVADGGNAIGQDIFIPHDRNIGGVRKTPMGGWLNLVNLDIRYPNSLNIAGFGRAACFNVSVLGTRSNCFFWGRSAQFDYCEAAGAGSLGAGGGDGWNAFDEAVGRMTSCYSHDNNDDGESAHGNCNITAEACGAEYNGRGGFVPASGAHAIYSNCWTRRNNRRPGASRAGFFASGSPTPDDDGVNTTMECYSCTVYDEVVGFGRTNTALAKASRSSAFDCETSYDVDVEDCTHGGNGAPLGPLASVRASSPVV